jgi:glycosyltransferase involved in cell wall biosynthesis
MQTKKKVLAIAYNFPPNSSSGSIRVSKLVNHMPALGWDLHVLTPHEKYFSDGGENGQKLLANISPEVNIIRTDYVSLFDKVTGLKKKAPKQAPPAGPAGNAAPAKSKKRSPLQGVKDFITDLVSLPDKQVGWYPYALAAAKELMDKNKVDVIYASGKPWISFFVGYRLKKIYHVPLVIEFRDPWTSNPWDIPKSPLLERLQNYMEKFIMKRVDHIIANTEESGQDMVDRKLVKKDKIEVITGGYDNRDFEKIKVSSEPNQKLTFTHVGTFYKNRNPYPFLKAVQELIQEKNVDPEKIKVHFIGRNMVQEDNLRQIVRSPEIEPVLENESWVEHEQAIRYLHESDVLLLIQPDTKLQIPAKLYEYIVTGKSILALSQGDGAVSNIIRREGWGDAVDGTDVAAIKKTVKNYYENFLSGKLNSGGRAYDPGNYEVGYLAKRLTGIFDQVIEKNKRH